MAAVIINDVEIVIESSGNEATESAETGETRQSQGNADAQPDGQNLRMSLRDRQKLMLWKTQRQRRVWAH